MDFLYILYSEERTYCGVTNDLHRRIQQHNGILKGGAKSTRGRKWDYLMILQGFQERRDVLQFEWRMHHPDGKRRKSSKYHGIDGRIRSLKEVISWWRSEKNHHEELKLYVHPNLHVDEIPTLSIFPLSILLSSLQISQNEMDLKKKEENKFVEEKEEDNDTNE